jgi:hypothetical protein
MLALREIAQSDITYSHVMPIIEPVRELATLDKTIQMMESANIHYAVILKRILIDRVSVVINVFCADRVSRVENESKAF